MSVFSKVLFWGPICQYFVVKKSAILKGGNRSRSKFCGKWKFISFNFSWQMVRNLDAMKTR